uniref:Solute carrier family 25 member 35-like n=1 Tax=Hirondellea gigas TaxID=1518452 RepID=A0A2P2HZ85_9CRUS
MDFLISSVAAVGAVIITNPMDVIKTRLQLQGELKAPGQYVKVYNNVLQAGFQMLKTEGIRGLQRGVYPAALYQMVMNGTRLSLYHKLQVNGYLNSSSKDGSGATRLSNIKCVLAGASVGVISGFIASPLYLVKVQLQSQADPRLAVGTQHNHNSVIAALQASMRTGGITGLYRGASTSLLRVGVGSAAQLFTYTKCRDALHNAGVCDMKSWSNALAGAMLSGVAVTACMTPFDVLSTRLYNQGVCSTTGKGLLYKNLLDCAMQIVRTEGPLALYKGWGAVYLRIGPHSFLSLVFWDVLKDAHQKWKTGAIGESTTPVGGVNE